ncbi:uncharacterized protein LOC123320007 [Coccinella septempunctata]|uniref:uncharacterized protein LOC123320007 n=1 Tax=Coccinella septempunctata TaxID=41139 RepID=UPI001D0911F3|nr:uncharacterized protein LOC123320007 [Coccinella septempunctata]
MNLLTCNMVRSNFASGLPSQNVSSKMQFHQSAVPSLMLSNKSPTQFSNKHFQNPNIFNQITTEKTIPFSYNHSNTSGGLIEERSPINSCGMIPVEIKQADSDSMLIEESALNCIKEDSIIPETETSTVVLSEERVESNTEVAVPDSDEDMYSSDSTSSDSDDSFIVFEAGEETEDICEKLLDEDDSSSDEDDDDWDRETIVFYNSGPPSRERQVSIAESEDSYILFGERDSEESSDEEDNKSDNGKKVTFAEGPELCTVHLMVKWSFAYRKARKGLWEQFARDNERFKYRANIFGATLDKFLQPEHRQKIYEERFKNRQE